MHNGFLYMDRIPAVHAVTNEDGWVATVGYIMPPNEVTQSVYRGVVAWSAIADARDRRLCCLVSFSLVRNAEGNRAGQVYAVVHQYDRSTALNEVYARRYFEPNVG